MLVLLVLGLSTVQANAHSMGRVIPVAYSGKEDVELAARVITEYFSEQMGRDMKLQRQNSGRECLDIIRNREAPMAVIYPEVTEMSGEGVKIVTFALDVAGNKVILVMGIDAANKLEFSLIPRYMEKLSGRLKNADWSRGLDRVRGKGQFRKVALDMLREAELL